MNILQPPTPKPSDTKLRWSSLIGSSLSLAITRLKHQGTKLIITADIHTAYQLLQEFNFYQPQTPASFFPDWEILPYDHFSAHEDIISERLLALNQLSQQHQGIMIASISTLMHRLAPASHTLTQAFVLEVKQHFDIGAFRHGLTHAGYHTADTVRQRGEFAVRGAIIDVFPMGSDYPLRIELFDNEIASLRTFDIETQTTLQKINSINLLSATEYPLTEAGINTFRAAWRNTFDGNPKEAPIYNAISEGYTIAGIEYYLPLFFDDTATIFDYLADSTLCFLVGDIHQAFLQHTQDIHHRYEQYGHNTERPILAPNALFLDENSFFSQLKKYQQIQLQHQPDKQKSGQFNFPVKTLPDMAINHQKPQPLELFKAFVQASNDKIIIVADSAGRCEVLLELLKDQQITPTIQTNWKSAVQSEQRINMIVGTLSQGFQSFDPALSVITENELFGNVVSQQRRRRKTTEQDPNSIIKHLTELKTGDPVVHLEHGIGLYIGLNTITTGDITAEYLTLEYANNDRIYVPISALHLINRYTCKDPNQISLQKLGSQQWQKAKEKAQQKIIDIAAELLDIYSQRAASSGYSFKKPSIEFQRFRSEFLFEETPDQTQAINATIHDMTSTISMDRLICGDVGFGKTEVAMQASFLAVFSNKQVAILAPTTLLAQQHYQNFCDRFANWPIKIAVISRMRTAKEQAHTIKECQNGKIDIIIGTHKLLSKEISFHDLGLLIVDEEHRFGVRHKERIKSLRANVDILTLTATPIPRTLNMSLSGTRDLSIIATPPQRRLSVNTFIYEKNDQKIQEAISREILRGGQVFFVHNNIATMRAEQEKINTLCPEAKSIIAHGQLAERKLEAIMSDFYHQKYNVLICTTIVESGIDIPTANTIIINRADHFGLAQLHQLRGRVGRSHHQAYAYLMIPGRKLITADARKRLDAFSQLDALGAGFTLATHDLEIRGAGELLGDEQSGHIHAIGFTLYMDMLHTAVQTLKNDKHASSINYAAQQDSLVELGVSTIFPEDYIPDANTRLSLYKRLACCHEKSEINEIKAEIIDRFGLLPTETSQLFSATQLKVEVQPHGISKIELGKSYGSMQFSQKNNIQAAKLVQLIQQEPTHYQLKQANILRFKLLKPTIESRIQQIHKIVDKIL